MKKNISILGSTGSIGTQTLDVLRRLKKYTDYDIKVSALSANKNIELLEEQILEFKPNFVVVMDEERAIKLKKRISYENINILSGVDGLIKISTLDEIDTVVTSVVGNIGLEPTLEAIKAYKNIALANKETLVSAGKLVMDLAYKKNINIFPVDSEHSAVFQCLQGNKENEISKLILTASGGAFKDKSLYELKNIEIEDALKHPNWTMGKKITIDSSTLMNKGLEVIEAMWLFNINFDKIEVVIHPQSIIHSAVEFNDGSIIAQMGERDMKLPIQYALLYPKRVNTNLPRLDFFKNNNLTFEKPNLDIFKCLKLAFESIKKGGTMPTVLNAANEVAVERFLNKEISFLQIPDLIEKTMFSHKVIYNYTLEDIMFADKNAREFAYNKIL